MENFLLFAGVVIIICIFMNRFAMKLPVPSLLVFIALGMCFGENGFFRISFDNYELSETICSVSLIFIMFYGGFGTNMKEARPVAVRAFLLSTAGVVLTAGFVGVFVHYLTGDAHLVREYDGRVFDALEHIAVVGIIVYLSFAHCEQRIPAEISGVFVISVKNNDFHGAHSFVIIKFSAIKVLCEKILSPYSWNVKDFRPKNCIK